VTRRAHALLWLSLANCLREDVELSRADAGQVDCHGVVSPVAERKLEILLLLDNSASMGLLPALPLECLTGQTTNCPASDSVVTPWTVATREIEAFVRDPRSAEILLALRYFGDDCSPESYQAPNILAGELPAQGDAIVRSLQATLPLAGTATRPALEGSLAYARREAEQRANTRVVIVMITDGYPDEEDCEDNSTDAVSRVAALGFNGLPSIPTYVFVAVTGLELGAVAGAGGTGQTILADLQRTGTLTKALNALRDAELATLRCSYDLLPTLSAQPGWPESVTLTSDSAAIAQVPGKELCSDASDGWYYDPASPTRIVACPRTCARLGGSKPKLGVDCISR